MAIVFVISAFAFWFWPQSCLNFQYAKIENKLMTIDTNKVYNNAEIYELTNLKLEDGQYQIDTSRFTKELLVKTIKNDDNIFEFLIVNVE